MLSLLVVGGTTGSHSSVSKNKEFIEEYQVACRFSRKAGLESTRPEAKQKQALNSSNGALFLLGLDTDKVPGSVGLRLQALVLLLLDSGYLCPAFASYVPSDICFSSCQLPNTSLVLVHLTDRADGNVPAAMESGKAWFWLLPWQGGSHGGYALDIGGQISLGSQKEWQKPTP